MQGRTTAECNRGYNPDPQSSRGGPGWRPEGKTSHIWGCGGMGRREIGKDPALEGGSYPQKLKARSGLHQQEEKALAVTNASGSQVWTHVPVMPSSFRSLRPEDPSAGDQTRPHSSRAARDAQQATISQKQISKVPWHLATFSQSRSQQLTVLGVKAQA